AWFVAVSLTGMATMLLGAYTALFKHDLKGLLAYSTVSHLGLITLLLGLGSPLAAVAAVFHIINHAVFKASLFMAAGIIDHESGTRDMRKLNGLWKYMPYTATLAMTAAASMAGVPLLNGFLSKEMLFAETLHQETLGALSWWIPLLATAGGALAVAYSLRFMHDVFFNGEPIDLPKTPHEPPPLYAGAGGGAGGALSAGRYFPAIYGGRYTGSRIVGRTADRAALLQPGDLAWF